MKQRDVDVELSFEVRTTFEGIVSWDSLREYVAAERNMNPGMWREFPQWDENDPDRGKDELITWMFANQGILRTLPPQLWNAVSEEHLLITVHPLDEGVGDGHADRG